MKEIALCLSIFIGSGIALIACGSPSGSTPHNSNVAFDVTCFHSNGNVAYKNVTNMRTESSWLRFSTNGKTVTSTAPCLVEEK